MAAKTPIRTVYTNNVATGLAEFQSGEFVDYGLGGTGLTALGSAGQVLKVNSGASALEYGAVEAILNIDGMTDGSGITIVDADKFAISDGGTEKYITASQLSTYITSEVGVNIDGFTDGTSITVAGTDRLLLSDSGTEKMINVSQIDTFVSGSTATLTNKTLTSPVLNTGVSGTAVADEDNMSSNSATKLATQQSIKAYVDAQVTAQDLDFQGDSGGALSIDLDSETLDIAGGTGIDTSGSSNTLTVAIDSTVATLTGTQTLTNKSLDLGTNTFTGSLAEFNTALQSESFASLTGSETLTNKTLTTPVIAEIDGSTITLDSAGDITLDAGGADIVLKDDGTEFGRFTNSSGELVVKSSSSATTALTFAGASATLAGNLTVTGTTTFNGGTITLGDAATDTIAFGGTVTGNIVFEGSSDDAHELTLSPGNPTGDVTVTLPVATDTLVGKATTDTFTNKSIDLGTNTLTGSVAEFNSALQSESFTTLTGSETLTNKTLASPVITTQLSIGSAVINEAELETIDGITAGTVAVSKAVVVDSNKDIGTFRNLTIDGTFSDGNYTFDTSGNVSGLGTVGSGAITSSGVVTATGFTIGSAAITEAELEILDGATVSTTELNYLDITTLGTSQASKAVTVDSDGDLIIPDSDKFEFGAGSDMTLYHDGTNSYLTNKTGALKIATETSGIALTIGHSTSEVTVADNLTVAGNLTVSGTETIVDTVTMQAENAIIFEGATADAYETTLTIVDPTSADKTVYLPNATGYLPLLNAASTTVITATPAELNYVDGVTSAIQTQMDTKATKAFSIAQAVALG